MARTAPPPSPYKGLIPYTERDSVYFFGREKETRLIIANLFASPLTLLYGPSGVGKSSVLRAGVVSELANRPNVNVVIHSDWKTGPLARLKSLVGARAGLGENIDTSLSFGEFLGRAAQQGNARFMLILDQFEEYFLYHPLEDEFTAQFARAVMQAGLPVSFLISIREDSLAKMDRFEGRIPILFDNYLRLDHLDEAAARNAIEKPLGKFNEMDRAGQAPIRIEADLTSEIIRQLKTGHVSLNQKLLGRFEPQGTAGHIETPYLQLVLTRLWAYEMASRSTALRLSSLNTLGGAAKIVRTHLDGVMSRLSSDHQMLSAQVFQFLVTPSGTKIALSAGDLASFVDAPAGVVKALLQRLAEPDVRLLRTVETSDKAGVSYEIFHDVLAAPILDWRERWLTRNRWTRRSLWLAVILAVVTGFVLLGASLLQTLFSNTVAQDLTDPSILTCLVPLVILCLVFSAIGFFAGINWARTK